MQLWYSTLLIVDIQNLLELYNISLFETHYKIEWALPLHFHQLVHMGLLHQKLDNFGFHRNNKGTPTGSPLYPLIDLAVERLVLGRV